jgi:hypothetical protein
MSEILTPAKRMEIIWSNKPQRGPISWKTIAKYPSYSPSDGLRIKQRKAYVMQAKVPSFEAMADLIPERACMVDHDVVSMLYTIDMHIIDHWLTHHPNPSLESLHLINVILNRWSKNHSACNPYWPSKPSEEEIEMWKKIEGIADRLIEKQGGIDGTA